MKRFCEPIDMNDGTWAVIATAPFAGIQGKLLMRFPPLERGYGPQSRAEAYAKEVNALARVYRVGRAAAAKEPKA